AVQVEAELHSDALRAGFQKSGRRSVRAAGLALHKLRGQRIDKGKAHGQRISLALMTRRRRCGGTHRPRRRYS
ncbi:hypothetical protein, partial [Paraburkholderia heleia]|uniref:hypothetical protein n=1 Tax=Paraburkholderia heleia TaxID=634127 RepID=UPI002AB78217